MRGMGRSSTGAWCGSTDTVFSHVRLVCSTVRSSSGRRSLVDRVAKDPADVGVARKIKLPVRLGKAEGRGQSFQDLDAAEQLLAGKGAAHALQVFQGRLGDVRVRACAVVGIRQFGRVVEQEF